MAETSNYLRTRILDHVLGTAELVFGTQLYLALSTSTLSPASTGATLAEPSWATRVAIDFNAADLSGPGGIGRAGHDAQIDFANNSGSGDTIVAAALVDSPTPGAGNVYYFDNDVPDTLVADGGTFRFPADQVAATQA